MLCNVVYRGNIVVVLCSVEYRGNIVVVMCSVEGQYCDGCVSRAMLCECWCGQTLLQCQVRSNEHKLPRFVPASHSLQTHAATTGVECRKMTQLPRLSCSRSGNWLGNINFQNSWTKLLHDCIRENHRCFVG